MLGRGAVGRGRVGLISPPATLNPLDKAANVTLTNSNFTASSNSTNGLVRATVSRSGGKNVYEVNIGNFGSCHIGFATAAELTSNYPGATAQSISYNPATSKVEYNGASITTNVSTVPGDVVMACVDEAAGLYWFGINGTWINGNPSAGTGGYAGPSGAIFPALNPYGNTLTVNFGASAFAIQPPTGFQPWNQTPALLLPAFDNLYRSANLSLSNFGRTATNTAGGANFRGARGTRGRSSGKAFFSGRFGSIVGSGFVGIWNGQPAYDYRDNNYLGADIGSIAYQNDGRILSSANQQGSGATYTGGDIIGIAYDFSAGKFWVSKNGVWQNGDPNTGTGGTTYSGPGNGYPYYVGMVCQQSDPMILSADTTGMPTGFTPWV